MDGSMDGYGEQTTSSERNSNQGGKSQNEIVVRRERGNRERRHWRRKINAERWMDGWMDG